MGRVISSGQAQVVTQDKVKGSLPEKTKPVTEATLVESIRDAAYRLCLGGKSNQEIAETLDVPVARVVRAIQSRMKTEGSVITSNDRTTLIQVHMDRYNAIISAHWDSAMYGDVKSTELVLKTMAQIERLQRLGDLDPAIDAQTVLVIKGEERDYVSALMELTEKPGEKTEKSA